MGGVGVRSHARKANSDGAMDLRARAEANPLATSGTALVPPMATLPAKAPNYFSKLIASAPTNLPGTGAAFPTTDGMLSRKQNGQLMDTTPKPGNNMALTTPRSGLVITGDW